MSFIIISLAFGEKTTKQINTKARNQTQNKKQWSLQPQVKH